MKKINRDKKEVLDEFISDWETQGIIDEQTGSKLRETYEPKSFDWQRLAAYAFWVAIACGIIALGAILMDTKLLIYLTRIYDTPYIVIAIISALVSTALYIVGFKRKHLKPQLKFSNEAIVVAAMMLTANAIVYLGKSLDKGSGDLGILLLFSLAVYTSLAFVFKSRAIWAFAILSLMIWFGFETDFNSQKNHYFLGMNFPLRFVVLGGLITLASRLMALYKSLAHFKQTTYICGLVCLFVSLWLLSIFGNFGNLSDWYSIRQLSLFYWAILSALVCIAFTWYGLKSGDEVAREFGITFLFLNLYTRYFEYFWDHWHKAIFFSLLAISFWLIGRKAEKIWRLH